MLHEIIHSADDLISSDGAWWILGLSSILLIPAIIAVLFFPREGLIAMGWLVALMAVALVARRLLTRKTPG